MFHFYRTVFQYEDPDAEAQHMITEHYCIVVVSFSNYPRAFHITYTFVPLFPNPIIMGSILQRPSLVLITSVPLTLFAPKERKGV